MVEPGRPQTTIFYTACTLHAP